MPEVKTEPAEGAAVVAAFDFDGTLTRGDTLLPFLLQVLGWRALFWSLLRCSPWLLAYAMRLLDNHRAKARLLRFCLGGRPAGELEAQARVFIAGHLAGAWRADMLDRLRGHQQAGHRCVIVSASPDIYLRAVAAHLGVADLLCTRLEVRDGRLSGDMIGVNCHGQEKLLRLREWMARKFHDPRGVTLHAYGDSRGDTAMLAAADYPVFCGRRWFGPGASRPWRRI